jgi:glutathione S-transferase
MFTLVIGNKNYSSWSLRPWVLMQTLGIPFTERLVPFGEPGSAEAFAALSPSARVPCLHDDGRRIWDSLAIVEYLAERHPGVWPIDPEARAFARSASAEMHSGFSALREQCSMSCGQRVTLREISASLTRDLDRLQSLWREGLERFGGPFLGGAVFTAVDAFFAPVAFRVQTYRLTLDPASMGYVARLLALPAMQAWYTAALREPWREPAHERAVANGAREIQDLRQP